MPSSLDSADPSSSLATNYSWHSYAFPQGRHRHYAHANSKQVLVPCPGTLHALIMGMAPLIFWADWVTIHQAIGYSPFFMAHGIEVVLPLDIAEATYLLPPLNAPASMEDLIVYRSQQLQKCPEDHLEISARVLKARKQSAAEFVKHFSTMSQDYDFPAGSLVLVWNSRIKKELNCKRKPHFLGPIVIVNQMKGGAYILAELNGTVSRLWYATFRIIHYLARFPDHIPVTPLMDEAELEDVQICLESFPLADDPSEEVNFDE